MTARRLTWLGLAAVMVPALFNAFLHDPAIGYDAPSHWDYVRTLAQGRLPDRSDSAQFFSPPLAYAPPALGVAAGLSKESGGRLALLVNALYGLAMCWFLADLCRFLGEPLASRPYWALACLALMPVFFRTLAFNRPEAQLALLSELVGVWLLRLALRESVPIDRLAAGMGLGGLLLCRQWGIFVLAACAVFAFAARGIPPERRRHLRVAVALGVVLGGWFYVRQGFRYGSAVAYVRGPAWPGAGAALARVAGGWVGALRDPFGSYERSGTLAVLYADFFADTQGYFSVYGRDRASGAYVAGDDLARAAHWRRFDPGFDTNRAASVGFQRRAVLAGAVPGLLLLAGLAGAWPARRGAGGRANGGGEVRLLSALIGVASLTGYLVWLCRYGLDHGNAVKATYLAAAFPYAALLAGDAAARISARGGHLRLALLAAFFLSAAAIYPQNFTRYLSAGERLLRPLYPESWGADAPAGGTTAGLGLVSSGAAPEPLETLERRAVVSPRNARLRSELGVARYLSGDIAGARRELEAALRLNPALGEASLSLAAVLMDQGELAEARRVLARGRERLIKKDRELLGERFEGSLREVDRRATRR